jgi:hypothetical protein
MASIEELEIITSEPQRRIDPRSQLMKLKSKLQVGQKPIVCPFGCKERNVGEQGYCRHVIGFTRDRICYEPMVRIKGRYVVQVPMKDSGEFELDYDEDGNPMRVPIMIPDYPLLQPGDKVCRISDCFRVYRKVDPSEQVPDPQPPTPRRRKVSEIIDE